MTKKQKEIIFNGKLSFLLYSLHNEMCNECPYFDSINICNLNQDIECKVMNCFNLHRELKKRFKNE